MSNELKDNQLKQVSGGMGVSELPAVESARKGCQCALNGKEILVPINSGDYQVGIDIPGSENYQPGAPEIPGFTIIDK